MSDVIITPLSPFTCHLCPHPLLTSLIQFFSKMRKWADMSGLPQDFRLRTERLERNFEVSTVIFRKFQPIFRELFQVPQGAELPRQPRSRKHRCTCAQTHTHTWCSVNTKTSFSENCDLSVALFACCYFRWFSHSEHPKTPQVTTCNMCDSQLRYGDQNRWEVVSPPRFAILTAFK